MRNEQNHTDRRTDAEPTASADWRTVEDLRDAVDDGALTTYTFPVDRLAVRGGGS